MCQERTFTHDKTRQVFEHFPDRWPVIQNTAKSLHNSRIKREMIATAAVMKYKEDTA
jgi:hypothetical protein